MLSHVTHVVTTVMYFLVIIFALTGITLCQDFLNQNILEDVQNVLKKKCNQNISEDAYLLLSEDSLDTCLEFHLNFTQAQEELQEARKHGLLDEFVKKYCDKSPQMYKCLRKTFDKLRPCMDSTEEEFVEQNLKFVNAASEKICHQNGLRVVLFIATGGLECLQQRQEQIQICINETVDHPSSDFNSFNDLSSLFFSVKNTSLEEACSHMANIRSCFRREMLKCGSVSANVMDAFLKHLKKEVFCKTADAPVQEDGNVFFLAKIAVGVVALFLIVVLSYKLCSCPRCSHKYTSV